MKTGFSLVALAATVAVVTGDSISNGTVEAAVNALTLPPPNTTNVFAPGPAPGVDRHNIAHVVPQANVSLFYGSNTTTGAINVNHKMKYPTILLEQIASIINVDCSPDSVTIMFNDSSVFATTQAAWTADGTVVFVTNHLGDCDPELERSFFVSRSLSFDNATLIATASSAKANVSSTAATTEITFGNIPTASDSKRDLTLDPSYTLSPAFSLPANTVIFSDSPYVQVTADTASFTSAVTFSGYLQYSWLEFKLKELYFDFDAGFTADLALSAEVTSTYNKTFTYSPSTLSYGISVPGVIELGPALKFAVDAEVYASEAVTLTTDLSVGLVDGNVHVDLLDKSNTATSGWVPTQSASANISGQAEAKLNPTASLTVEIAIDIFGGLIDLSTGLTAKPGFTNDFILTAAEGVDLSGVQKLTANGTCQEGLEIESDFVFSVDAFATEWYSTELYNVDVPILKECFSWA